MCTFLICGYICALEEVEYLYSYHIKEKDSNKRIINSKVDLNNGNNLK